MAAGGVSHGTRIGTNWAKLQQIDRPILVQGVRHGIEASGSELLNAPLFHGWHPAGARV